MSDDANPISAPAAVSEALSPAMQADYDKWLEKQKSTKPAAVVFKSLREEFEAMAASWPEQAEVPYELTEEGERMTRFKKMCPEEFLARIDRTKLRSPAAFDRVAQWDGKFPGPLATGETAMAKTRAAWSALGRLWVRERRGFATFTARRLVTEFERYESKGSADEFYRHYSNFQAVLIDDVDKINWQFDSQTAALFACYDWVYSKHIPCISTTNKDRSWWADKMGDAFARRLFDGAHFEVKF